ncbi:MAG: 4'-phosphopantetheinyl transferase family protein [Oscillospiraceae bacterium]
MLKAYCCESQNKKDTRALLALAMTELYGIALPQVEKDRNGKPFFPGLSHIHFSLSHTKSHVMIVVGDVPCGCDIETVRNVREGLAERVCSNEELRHFDFFQCWVLKESFIKVSGDVTQPLDKTCFSLKDGVIVTPSPDISARLYDVYGCRAAVCAMGAVPEALSFIPSENLFGRT